MIKITQNNNFDALRKLACNIEELQNTTQISLRELLSPSFISNCSEFATAEELFDASGYKVDSLEDFAAIPDADWDAFISKNTTFSNWKELQTAAVQQFVKQKLGF